MQEPLLLLVVVVLSYFAAHVVFDRLARRFALVSGAEYLVLGLVLGPEVAGLLPPHAVESFSPLITLGLGWIGTLVGTQLALPRLVRTPAARYRVALAEVLLTALVIGLAEFAVLHWAMAVPTLRSVVVASAFALVALPASAAAVGVVAREQGEGHPIVRQLEVATALQSVAASAGLALLFAILHTSPTSLPRDLVPTEWMAITIAIGVVGGTLFHIFVGDERKVDRLFISLAGAIILISGAAAALRLSPVFAALVFGAILGNTRGRRTEVITALTRVERPFYFALMIFAGASWQQPGPGWALPLFLFLLLRPIARLATARLSARLNGAVPELGPHWGRALIGHGGFALVLAFDYMRQGRMPNGPLVFSAAIASLLLTDVVSARIIRSVLRLPTTMTGGTRDPILAAPGARATAGDGADRA